jgi:cysteine desulfuration protein SufE
MTIETIQNEIIEDFEFLDDWEQKYEYIIELGKKLPPIQEQFKSEEYLIKGCQSRVWLRAELQDSKLYYTADSDALITKGIVSLLIKVLNAQPAEDIAAAELFFIEKIGLQSHLSPTRSNGLRSMIVQMQSYAKHFSETQNQN